MLDIPFYDDTDIVNFPDPTTASTEPDGLLALGGNLSTPTLINAYKNAIFPWFSEEQPLLWWSPSERAIFETNSIHISKNMRKLLKQSKYYTTADTHFSQVTKSCAKPSPIDTRPDTWITKKMQNAYLAMHQKGYAHSIEVWNEKNRLVGGLYGVFINNCFCGESMFSLESNTSKIALISLVRFLHSFNCNMIDCQLPTEHLLSLGAKIIMRNEFIKKLNTKQDNSSLTAKTWETLWQQY